MKIELSTVVSVIICFMVITNSWVIVIIIICTYHIYDYIKHPTPAASYSYKEAKLSKILKEIVTGISFFLLYAYIVISKRLDVANLTISALQEKIDNNDPESGLAGEKENLPST